MRADVALGEFQKGGPVGAGGVAEAVLAEGYVARNERCFDCGHFGYAQIFFAEKAIDRTGTDSS
jgi:hypothetical protein